MVIRATLALLVLCLPAGTAAQVRLTPCTIPEVEGGARCGTYRVFEDRASRRGRTIELNVVVLTATGQACRAALSARADLTP